MGSFEKNSVIGVEFTHHPIYALKAFVFSIRQGHTQRHSQLWIPNNLKTLFEIKTYLFYFMCLSILPVSMCSHCVYVPDAHRGQRRVLDSLKLE